nr:hypothetical protein [Psychrobacter sp.]
MKQYEVKYTKTGSTSINRKTVKSSSASDAREQIKSQYNGKVAIVSCVEK